MCGRSACTRAPIELVRATGASTFANPCNYTKPNFNVGPGCMIPVLRMRKDYHNTTKEREALESKFGDWDPEEEKTTVKPESHVKSEDGSGGSNSPLILQAMKWGLIPVWSHSATAFSQGYKMINARVETVNSNSYKRLLNSNRCAVCFDAIYEWAGEKGSKTPMLIFPSAKPENGEIDIRNIDIKRFENVKSTKSDENEEEEKAWQSLRPSERPLEAFNSLFPLSPFTGAPVLYLAALWDCWQDTETHNRVYSVTILTTEPTQQLSSIHDRMPVVLSTPDRLIRWLDCERYSFSECISLLSPFKENGLIYYPVTNYVNAVANKTIECIKPAPKAEEEKKNKGIKAFFGSGGTKAKLDSHQPIRSSNTAPVKTEEHQTQSDVKQERIAVETVKSESVDVKLEPESVKSEHAAQAIATKQPSKSSSAREIEQMFGIRVKEEKGPESDSDVIEFVPPSASSGRSPAKSTEKLQSPNKKRGGSQLAPGQTTLSFGMQSPNQADKKSKHK